MKLKTLISGIAGLRRVMAVSPARALAAEEGEAHTPHYPIKHADARRSGALPDPSAIGTSASCSAA